MSKNLVKKIFRRDGTTGTSFIVPAGVKFVEVFLKENFTQESNSFNVRYAMTDFGHLFGWGPGGYVGDSTNTTRVNATNLAASVSIDFFRKPFLRADGAMMNIGRNTFGQIGDGTTIPKSSFTLVTGGHVFKKVKEGETCVGLTEGGDLYLWGNNANGQIGDGTVIPKSTPVLVMSDVTDFWTDTRLDYFTFVVPNVFFAKKTDNSLWAWGKDTLANGILGINTAVSTSTPTLVSNSINFIEVSVNSALNHTLALADNGDVYSWGNNAFGELGDNTIVKKSTPTLVIGGAKYQKAIAGSDCSGALTRDGSIHVWGNNTQGQLGQNNIFPKSSPVTVTVLNTSSKKRLFVTGQTMYAIDSQGDYYAWGFQNATNPLLGDGTTTKRSTPTIVFGSTNADRNMGFDIIADSENIHTIRTDGTRVSWGVNSNGESGTGQATSVKISNPLLVSAAVNMPVAPWSVQSVLAPCKIPGKKVERQIFPVVPGQEITLSYQLHGFVIPELGIVANPFVEEIEFQWQG